MRKSTANRQLIQSLMHNIEQLINKLLMGALHRVEPKAGVFFDIFTYGGDTGPEYRYMNINSKQVKSLNRLKIYFNGTVKYKNKSKFV